MKQSIVHIALVVKDYDEAIDFYTCKLNFELIEDTYQPEQNKRWVVVSPPGSNGVTLLLAKASRLSTFCMVALLYKSPVFAPHDNAKEFNWDFPFYLCNRTSIARLACILPPIMHR